MLKLNIVIYLVLIIIAAFILLHISNGKFGQKIKGFILQVVKQPEKFDTADPYLNQYMHL